MDKSTVEAGLFLVATAAAAFAAVKLSVRAGFVAITAAAAGFFVSVQNVFK
jgi:hypothetical protein